MERRNLAAYTAAGSEFPPYVSINQDDAGVEVIVRAAGANGREGSAASVTVPVADFVAMVRRIVDVGVL